MNAIPRFAGFVVLAICAMPVAAKPLARARVVSCDAEDCVLIRGHRASVASVVQVNAHAVAARGGRTWTARVPVATVRSWSAPFARSIDVTVVDADGVVERSGAVRLPVGLLGHDVELASLVVHMP